MREKIMNSQLHNFLTIAKNTFPDMSDTISSKQIRQIIHQYNLPWPTIITNPMNRVGRGIYSLANLHASIDTTTFTMPEPVIEDPEEIRQRIHDTFDSLNILVNAVSSNAVNSLVISGGAGIGKSHTVNEILTNSLGEENYVFHRGYLKATHLFRMLWENRHAGQVIVLDDVDLWKDEQTLNLLKAALELKSIRKIGWGTEKEFLDSDGEIIPRYFEYEGSVVFLTNENVYDLIDAQNKNAPHLKAIESRSLVLDMRVRTKAEYLEVIKIKMADGLLESKDFTTDEQHEIMDFIEENIDKMRDMSLRMVEKVASLYRIEPDQWQTLVRGVMFK
jgi:hypothetical protein